MDGWFTMVKYQPAVLYKGWTKAPHPPFFVCPLTGHDFTGFGLAGEKPLQEKQEYWWKIEACWSLVRLSLLTGNIQKWGIFSLYILFLQRIKQLNKKLLRQDFLRIFVICKRPTFPIHSYICLIMHLELYSKSTDHQCTRATSKKNSMRAIPIKIIESTIPYNWLNESSFLHM